MLSIKYKEIKENEVCSSFIFWLFVWIILKIIKSLFVVNLTEKEVSIYIIIS